jgi:precorrin-6A/cobalt-precorrin-6A reductase
VILILGGTAEARALAAALDDDGTQVVSSLAGRVSRPRLPRGEVRIGGFGGPDGLAAWLRERDVTAIVDATHPFAERISASAWTAAQVTETPLVRLERAGWRERSDDRWHRVATLPQAAALVPAVGARVFLTTGRQGLAAFAANEEWFLIRCVDPPSGPLPARHELVLDRGPYTLAAELELIDRFKLDVLVTKDSGGEMTIAKLDAARERGLPVIVVDRPPRPETPHVDSVAAARTWVARLAGG